MNNWINTLLPIICLIFSLIGLVRFLSGRTRLTLVGVFPIFFYISFLCGSIIFYVLKHDISDQIKETWLYYSLSLMSGIYITSYILLFINDWTDKKIKTLYRIPIIILLLGSFFGDERVFYLLLFVEVIAFVISFVLSKKDNYVCRLQKKQIFFLPILILMVVYQDSLFYLIYFVLTLGFKSSILNALTIKNIIYRNNELGLESV